MYPPDESAWDGDDTQGSTLRGIAREPFGTLSSGEDITRYTLTNGRGSIARLIDLGATLIELWMPDRDGMPGDVVLGFDTAEAYASSTAYLGCTVGRVANRIAGARFDLDRATHVLAANDGRHHLHGGVAGFDKAIWSARPVSSARGPALEFAHASADGEEGYPGSLDAAVTVTLDEDDSLHFDYRAHCASPTVINLTNHSYWNLAGRGDVLEHELRLAAKRYTEVGGDLIPTGRLLPVSGTPFDFTRAKPIGRDLADLELGYDHNFVLADEARSEPSAAAELRDPASGRWMRVSTTEPGIQLYTGNFLEDLPGKRGATYERHSGLCLEAQHFPDAPHQPEFPTIVLRPGETYRQHTVHAFGAE